MSGQMVHYVTLEWERGQEPLFIGVFSSYEQALQICKEDAKDRWLEIPLKTQGRGDAVIVTPGADWWYRIEALEVDCRYNTPLTVKEAAA